MGQRPKRICKACRRNATRERVCEACASKGETGSKDDRRLSPSKRGYDSTWQKLRKMFLAENPICQDCLAAGKLKPATEVHHKAKIADSPNLRLETTNLVGYCKSCHSRRTAKGE